MKRTMMLALAVLLLFCTFSRPVYASWLNRGLILLDGGWTFGPDDDAGGDSVVVDEGTPIEELRNPNPQGLHEVAHRGTVYVVNKDGAIVSSYPESQPPPTDAR